MRWQLVLFGFAAVTIGLTLLRAFATGIPEPVPIGLSVIVLGAAITSLFAGHKHHGATCFECHQPAKWMDNFCLNCGVMAPQPMRE